MRIRWHGQSAYTLSSDRLTRVLDPFDQRARPAGLSVRFGYPQIPQQRADLALVTHEHFDHNGVGVLDGDPQIVRSTAGRIDTAAVGEVVAIASEHDAEAGTRRGPNTIYVFGFEGIRVCHMGDFGQSALRPDQRGAIGEVDLLFVPVGGRPTADAGLAAAIVRELQPRWAIPMHYRTNAINFLDPPDAFLAEFESVVAVPAATFDLDQAPGEGGQHIIVLESPSPKR
jgi:L-ascorbate metabolism protein UlaG (beta-lactamase superfamily)